MQTNKEAEQVTLSDLGICCGKMFQEPSPAELPKARTSVSSSKRSSELSAVPFMSLDLTPGYGNLLGESYWELISPWLGGAWGVAQRRKRIFLVADFAGRTADKILFIPEGMLGDPAPSF